MKLPDNKDYKGGHEAPEGYFDTLYDRIEVRLQKKSSNSIFTLWWDQGWKAAAAVLLLIGAYLIGYQQGSTVDSNSEYAWFSDKQLIIHYLEDENIPEEQIYSLFTSTMSGTSPLQEYHPTITNETLEYLENETLDDELFL